MVAFAKRTGLCASTLAVDLTKYYEMTSHDELLEQGTETCFPLALLRALCSSYRLQRRAMLGDGVGPVIEANGASAAGCSCAVGVAKLLTYALLKAV
eukprot:3684911-Pyramimonas_sp.AAC.1